MTETTHQGIAANILKRPFAQIDQLSARDKAYQTGDPALRPFYKYDVRLESFDEVIAARQNYATNRKTLHRALTSQYNSVKLTPAQADNLQRLLDEQTYTVITAHQPSLLTGPLYFIYKIASTIHLAKDLSARYADKHVVPVFVTGGEDHDFEEINHLHLFGKTISWDTAHGGAVGRLGVETLEPVLQEVSEILGSSAYADEARDILRTSLEGASTYFEFTRSLVQALFGKYGVLVASMDDPKLKRQFVPVIKQEVFDQVSKPLITATQDALTQEGFSTQAHVRDINMFYLTADARERIETNGTTYSVVNQSVSWTRTELEAEIDEHPERFSPNVNLRPIYQEMIFPNLAYIGGGGELAYWMERQSQFDALGIPYPMLVRRNSVMLVDNSSQRSLDKLSLSLEDIWQPTHEIINTIINAASTVDLDITQEASAIEAAYKAVAERAAHINPGLGKYVLAEETKALKQIEQIGSRLKREIKKQEEVKVKQVQKLVDKLFPSNGLQERHDNIWQYYITYGHSLIDYLVDHLDPMDKDFIVVQLLD